MPDLTSLRDPISRLLGAPTSWLVGAGVHPNAVTTVGFLVTVGAAWCYHAHSVRAAGALVLLGGLLDIFDGQVARLSGLASKFGSFYDSTLDRISEIAVFLGILSLFKSYRDELGDGAMTVLIALALGGSLMVSYTRARAEGLGLDCKVGLMQRAERVILLGGGSLLFGLAWGGLVLKVVIAILAIGTNLTAVQRIVWVYRHAAGVPLEEQATIGKAARRGRRQ